MGRRRNQISTEEVSAAFANAFVSLWEDGHLRSMRSIEIEVIEKIIAMCGGDKAVAAGVLGVSLKTIYNKLGKEVAQ